MHACLGISSSCSAVDLFDPVGNSEIIVKSKFESCLHGEPFPPHGDALGNEVTSGCSLVNVRPARLSGKTQKGLLSGPGLRELRAG